MKLGYVMTPQAGQTDALLTRFAQGAATRGLCVHGIVQTNTDCAGQGKCDMDVRVLPDGPSFRISQSLGAGSRGCRLDAAALETAVGHVMARLDAMADLLVVNKFGKQEAAGQGMRAPIAAALDLGVPVLLGLNTRNHAAFDAFACGLAEQIAPDLASLEAWLARAPAAA